LTENKKILIISECFYPEEFKINDVALSWIEKGFDVDVLTLVPTYPLGRVLPDYKNSIFSKEIIKGLKVYRVHAVTGYNSSKFKKILKYINFMILGTIVALFIGRKYDYVFGFNIGALSDMLPVVVIRKIYKKPVTLWVQDLWPDSVYEYGFKKTKFLSFVLEKFVKFIFANIDNIAISSKSFKSNLKKYVKSKQKFHHVPNWSDELNMKLEPISLSEEKKIHFLFAGNIGKFQNLENIINAFSLLPLTYLKKAQLNIIGDGSNLSSLRSIKIDNIPIIFYGKIKRDLISQYYKASDFLIISLINKPIFSLIVPAKLQTYIAVKKPIIAIINGETAKIVNDNSLGLCTNPDDLLSIVELFKRCIDMPDTDRKMFIVNNDHLLSNLYNKKVIINKLTDILT
jgi:glycosyltransferase involved in cell wall biosynthesis